MFDDMQPVGAVHGPTLTSDGAAPDPFLGRTLNGRFRITRRLGRGGMGTVYLADQLSIGRPVALKILRGDFAADDEFVARFRDEARAAAAVRHPNVVVVYDYDRDADGNLFIAMEHLEGIQLSDVIQREGPLSVDRAIGIATQIAQGLEAAHGVGVVHRDVKPANVMVRSGFDVKLMDFGIARLRQFGNGRLTAPGTILGTPRYMAPEQIEDGEVSAAADIYALGILLYEMLAGTVPFTGSSMDAVFAKHLRERPSPLSLVRGDIPEALEAVVSKALQKRPDDRQQNMAQVIDGLRQIRDAAFGGVMSVRLAATDATVTQPGATPLAPDTARPVAASADVDAGARHAQRRRRLARHGLAATMVSAALAGAVLAWSTYLGPRIASHPPGVAPLPVDPQITRLDPEAPPKDAAPIAPPKSVVLPPATPDPAPAVRHAEPGRVAGPQPKDPAKAEAARAGARTRALVEAKLRSGGFLKSHGSDWGVTVRAGDEGVITLTGVLRDVWEREETIRLAGEVPGIREIRERINIRDSWSRASD
jgi:eukaryotic-like serine/threonine-protein kinase